MAKKYLCKTCNYSTDRLFNYNKHIKTKRHTECVLQKPVSENETTVSENETTVSENETPKVAKCKYCNKEFAHKCNIYRHERNCDLRVIKIDKEQKETQLEQALKQNEKLAKVEREREILSHDLEALKEDYHKLVIQIAENYTKPKKPIINMFYIMNNFNDAKNFDELMAPSLTETELAEQRELGDILAGSVKLITSRCVDGLSVSERPIHCLDTARNKYLLRHSNKWHVDCHGDKLLDTTFKKMYRKYLTDIKGCTDIEKTMKKQQQLLRLSVRKNQLKIIKDLNNRLDIKSIDPSKLISLK